MIHNLYEQQQARLRAMAETIDDDELAIEFWGKKRISKPDVIKYFGCPDCRVELGEQCKGVMPGETHRERVRFAYAYLEVLNKYDEQL